MEFARNHAINLSTDFSPFNVVYGVVPRCPLDLTPIRDQLWVHGKAQDFVGQLQHINKTIHEHLQVANAKYKQDADVERWDAEFEVRNFV